MAKPPLRRVAPQPGKKERSILLSLLREKTPGLTVWPLRLSGATEAHRPLLDREFFGLCFLVVP
jgi:hypothetical protein